MARITLVTRLAYHPLFRHHPAVAEVLSPAEARRRPPPDLCIDLQNRVRTRLLARHAGRTLHWRKRQGFDLLRTLGGRPLHRSYLGGPHQLERLAAALGLPPLRPPELPVSVRSAATPAAPYAVLAPGTAHPTKRWPTEHFHALGAALRQRGLQVVAVGGPGEGPLLEAAVRHTGTAVPTTVPLDEVAALLAGAAVVVGGDTGLMHLAAAVRAPVAVIFGPTPPGRWGPHPERGLVVARGLPCAPCSDHGRRPCPLKTQACLRTLTVQEALTAVEKLLSKTWTIQRV